LDPHLLINVRRDENAALPQPESSAAFGLFRAGSSSSFFFFTILKREEVHFEQFE
jgi:hypothetical protein